jgi:hypothetical protein
MLIDEGRKKKETAGDVTFCKSKLTFNFLVKERALNMQDTTRRGEPFRLIVLQIYNLMKEVE